MNILFFYDSQIDPSKGGVQRVTFVLDKYFSSCSYSVYHLSARNTGKSHLENLSQYYLPDEEKIDTMENLLFSEDLIKRNKIEVIINQGVLGKELAQFCHRIKCKCDVKIIGVLHNSLLGNVTHYTVSHSSIFDRIRIPFLKNILQTKNIKKLIILAYWIKYHSHYEFIVKNYDKVVILSSEYMKELRFFYANLNESNIVVIPNPCTLSESIKSRKINEIIYVGRIDVAQKKVDYLIEIWKKVSLKYPAWELSIIGDGRDRVILETMVKKIGLERVKFHGNCDPVPFYSRAKICCMTSSYEGFPLVLLEAQVFGTVPIAFSSFSAIKDLIIHDYNGILIEPFEFDSYVSEMSKLMDNENLRSKLSENGKVFVRTYSLETIGSKWLSLFNDLKIGVLDRRDLL